MRLKARTSADSQPTKLRGAFFWLSALFEGEGGSTSLERGNRVSCRLIITVISFWIWGVAVKKRNVKRLWSKALIFWLLFSFLIHFLQSSIFTWMGLCSSDRSLQRHEITGWKKEPKTSRGRIYLEVDVLNFTKVSKWYTKTGLSEQTHWCFLLLLPNISNRNTAETGVFWDEPKQVHQWAVCPHPSSQW